MRNHQLRLVALAASVTALSGVAAGCASEASSTQGASRGEATGSSQELVSGATCSDKVATMLSAPIAPPRIGDMNLARSDADGGLVGLTYGQTRLSGCEQYREPERDPAPSYPGYRYAAFSAGGSTADGGIDPNDPVTVAYNEESRVVQQVVLAGSSVTGTLTFQSRQGGKYGSGHTYVLSLANGGSLTKDGADFPADWSYVQNKKHGEEASAWANEVYDGIIATFDPTFAPAADGDCATSTFTFDGTGLPVPNQAECLYVPSDGAGSSYLGVRDLHFYMVFSQGTNKATTVYEDALAGLASCATPGAAIERMDWSGIYWGQGYNATSGYGVSIGGLVPNQAVSNAAGLTSSEAQTLNGCGGVSVAAPDPGYGAIAWGESGEVLLEYNQSTGVAYKVAVRPGYKGSFAVSEALSDGGTASYVVAPGTLTLNGAPLTIDWTTAATAAKTITGISNAFESYNLGLPDALDCRHVGACTIVLDDGQGNATFTLTPPAKDVGPSLGLTFVFPNKTSVPTEIYTVNPGGQ